MSSKNRPAGMDSLKMNHGKSSFSGEMSAVKKVSGGSPNAPKQSVEKRTPGGASPKR